MTSAADKPVATSVMQFSLRAIMVGVSVSAVACAVVAPFFRLLSPQMQLRVFGLLLAIAFGTLLYTASACARRRRLENQAGTVLLQAPMLSLRSVRWMFIGSLLQSATMLFWSSARLIEPNSPRWGFLFALLLATATGYYVSQSFLYVWWRRAMVSLVLCENGIIINALRFIPWNELGGSHWSFERGYFCWAARKLYMNGFQLPAELRDEADRIMSEHIPDARPPREASRQRVTA